MRNLPSRFTVRVNKTNIRRGRKGDSDTCAIAKAIARQIQAKRRDAQICVVGGCDIEVTIDGVTTNYEGRTELVRNRIDNFISKFDNKKKLVKPWKFRVVKKSW